MFSFSGYPLSVQINLLSNDAANSTYPVAVRGQLHCFSHARYVNANTHLILTIDGY